MGFIVFEEEAFNYLARYWDLPIGQKPSIRGVMWKWFSPRL